MILFDPMRFVLGLIRELFGYWTARTNCQIKDHDWIWVRRSMGDRCECGRCGRPVAR